jgi:type II secretory pathway pseudopilin PulG
MVVAIGLMLALYTLVTQSLFRGTHSATLAETADQLVRDAREAQFKAMQGTSPDGTLLDYSIRFEADRYTVFPGSVYSAGNANNQVVLLPPTMTISTISMGSGMWTFARSSGDIRSYVAGAESVTVSDTGSGKTETITVNARGIPTIVISP